jgi:hypothetical protein
MRHEKLHAGETSFGYASLKTKKHKPRKAADLMCKRKKYTAVNISLDPLACK